MFSKKQRFYRVPLSRRVTYLLMSIALTIRFAYLHSEFKSDRKPSLSAGSYIATDIVDPIQLTIKDNAGQEFNVRIIGIRAATHEETWRNAATLVTKKFCLGRSLTIRLDKRRIDDDGTHLAHVYVGDELLSYHLVKNGMAVVHLAPSDSPSIIRQLTKAESIAKQNRIGFWSKSPKPKLTMTIDVPSQ
jgi:endonuclease YncB( thermonuclease family)